MSAELREPVAGVVLKDSEGRYLLVQERQPKAYGLWNLPAGWIDPGESAQEAAIREAKEEVGLDVELISDRPVLSTLNSSKTRMLNSFQARIKGGELKFQKEELLDVGWFSLEEIEKLNNSGRIRDPWVIKSIYKVENV